jgi:hypothetical protein
MAALRALAALALLAATAEAFYLPGVAPQDFAKARPKFPAQPRRPPAAAALNRTEPQSL